MSSTKAIVGAVVHLSCKAVDPFSDKVDLSFAVTDAKGRRVTSGHPGLTATGTDVTVSWKPPSRGVFTVTWHAVDAAGNHEAKPVTTTITVR